MPGVTALQLLVRRGRIQEVRSHVGETSPTVVTIAAFPDLCLITDDVPHGYRPTAKSLALAFVEAVDNRYDPLGATVGAASGRGLHRFAH